MERRLKYFSEIPEKYSITENGGLLFSVGGNSFHILDDQIKGKLVERAKQFEAPDSEIFLEGYHLQTCEEAKAIIESRPKFLRVNILYLTHTVIFSANSFVKYSKIYEEVLLDIKVTVIAPSPVPLFAWEAYADSDGSLELQNLIETAATRYSDLSPEDRKELEGKIFVAHSAESFEIMDDYSFTQIKHKPAVCFVFGNLVGSTYFRVSKSTESSHFKVMIIFYSSTLIFDDLVLITFRLMSWCLSKMWMVKKF